MKYFFTLLLLLRFSSLSYSHCKTLSEFCATADSLSHINKPSQSNDTLLKYLPSVSKSNNLDLTASYNDLIGLNFLSIGDLQEAHKYLSLALKQRLSLYGHNDFKTAISYMHLGNYYNDRMYIDSAFQVCSIAKSISQRVKCNCHQKYSILNSWAYAYKIHLSTKYPFQTFNHDSARTALKQALDVIPVSDPDYLKFKANYLHSVGNTYTDQVYNHIHASDKAKAYKAFKLANEYYNLSIDLFRKLPNGKDNIATTYYTMYLAVQYLSENDSLLAMINYIDKSLKSVLPDYSISNALKAPVFKPSDDNYFLMVIGMCKIRAFKDFYIRTKDQKYLIACYDYCLYLDKIWDDILVHFKSAEVNQVVSLYSGLPFNDGVYSSTELYKLTRNSKYQSQSFLFSEKGKYSSVLKKWFTNNKSLENCVSQTKIAYPSIPEVQQNLISPKQAFIDFYDDGERLYANVIIRSNSNLISFDFTEKARTAIKHLYSCIISQNTDSINFFTNQLSEKLIKPILDKLNPNIDELIISNHGITELIPFDILPLNPRLPADYLIKYYSISSAFSAKILSDQLLPSNNLTDFKFIIGNNKKLSPLTFSEDLFSQFNKRYSIFESKFTDLESLQSSGIVHIVTHSSCNASGNSQAFLYFNDKSLTLSQFDNLNCKTRLLILEACETSKGKIQNGEGVMSFARSFVQGGCKAVVSTNWQVDDKATSEILNEFYRGLERGLPSNKALQMAKLNYLTQNAESKDLIQAYYWAGIQLSGNYRKIELPVRFWIRYKDGLILLGISLVFGLILVWLNSVWKV